MTIGSFAFSPVFLSIMAFLFFINGKYKPKTTVKSFIAIFALSFFICFIYPLVKTHVTNSYNMFDDFYLFCFISSLIAVAINSIFFIMMRLKNGRN